MIIKEVKLTKILNSRSQWTIQATVITDKLNGVASAPSGASTGKREVKQYNRSIDHTINSFKRRWNIKFNSFSDLAKVEKKILNGKTINQIGGNLVIAIEYAILDAWAKSKKKLLGELIKKELKIKEPFNTIPLGNIIGGGAHSGGNSTDFQEFLITAPGAEYKKALQAIIEVHAETKKRLLEVDKNFSGSKTDEGAWASTLTNYECLSILREVADRVGKKHKITLRLGLDVAASEFFEKNKYHYNKFNHGPKREHLPVKKTLHREAHLDYILHLVEQFNLFYLEDPVDQNDSEGFGILKNHLGFKDTLIVGDDLICTNPSLLKKHKNKINAVIVKPNQVGSLIKTIEIIKMCAEYEITPIISHRSGETTDSILADLAAGFNVPFIKCGATTGERVAKLNKLLEY